MMSVSSMKRTRVCMGTCGRCRALRSSHVITAQDHTDQGASTANCHFTHQAERTQTQLSIWSTVQTERTADPDRGCNQQTVALVPAAAGLEQPTVSTLLPPMNRRDIPALCGLRGCLEEAAMRQDKSTAQAAGNIVGRSLGLSDRLSGCPM